jgi:hypothetical protein
MAKRYWGLRRLGESSDREAWVKDAKTLKIVRFASSKAAVAHARELNAALGGPDHVHVAELRIEDLI